MVTTIAILYTKCLVFISKQCWRLSQGKHAMRKRTVKLWRLNEDGRKIAAGSIEAADHDRSGTFVPTHARGGTTADMPANGIARAFKNSVDARAPT
jgi:hypothetical protein